MDNSDVLVDCPVPAGEACNDCQERVDALACVIGRADPIQPPDDGNAIVYRCPTCATLLTEALRDLAVAAMLLTPNGQLASLLAEFRDQRKRQRAFMRETPRPKAN